MYYKTAQPRFDLILLTSDIGEGGIRPPLANNQEVVDVLWAGRHWHMVEGGHVVLEGYDTPYCVD